MKNEVSAAGNLIQIISQSRQNALKKVNEELIQMYWKVGEYLSTESMKTSFGDAYIDTVAEEIQNAFLGIKGLKENPFLDSYVMEFLDLPSNFKEPDLRKGLIRNMKDFILEVGRDFTFIDEEFRVQVGGEDYKIDLLFFHRGLQCLVAFELKVGKFKPEYISKMDFYLEALDRQKKKENENPSVGMILCASKDDEVVEYAMSRTLSPMMVAEYQLQLPDKNILQKKLQELINMPLLEDDE